MEKDFYSGQFTKRALPKSFKLNKKIATYLISLMNRNQPVWQNVLVRSFENEFNKTKIVLPVKNNEIDFNFMETFISELENNRLEPLRNYLKSDS